MAIINVRFPILVKFKGCDELIVISSEQAWLTDEELTLYITTEQDVVIDSNGHLFQLCKLQTDGLKAEPHEYIVSLENIVELIQAHFATDNSCCVSKFSLPANSSVADAIACFSASLP